MKRALERPRPERCQHPELLLDLATGERRCTACNELVHDDDPVEYPDPLRGSLRTLFEVRGRTWFIIGVGALCGAAIYLLLRVLH